MRAVMSTTTSRHRASCLVQMFQREVKGLSPRTNGIVDALSPQHSVLPLPALRNITGMQVAIFTSVRYHNAGPSGRAPSGGHSLSRRV